MVTPNNKGQGQYNAGAYSNLRLDELTGKIQTETDDKLRNDYIREAFKIVQDDVAYIPLHQQALAWGCSNRVSLAQLPHNHMYFKWVTVNMKSAIASTRPRAIELGAQQQHRENVGWMAPSNAPTMAIVRQLRAP